MKFEVISSIKGPEQIARGTGVKIRKYLRKAYGPGRWRKLKHKPHMSRTNISFALCIDNTEYEASLIPAKVYRVVPDQQAAKDDLIRIVDESGEDYLYHKSLFALIDLPPLVGKQIMALEGSRSS